MRRTLAVLCTAGPFVAGAIAAVSARHDFRMAWIALVVTAIAYAVVAVLPRAQRGASAGVSLALGTIAASVVAWMAGARAPFGIIAVAVVMAAFATAGVWLRLQDSPATPAS